MTSNVLKTSTHCGGGQVVADTHLSKAKGFKEKYEAKVEIPKGWEAPQKLSIGWVWKCSETTHFILSLMLDSNGFGL